MATKAPGELEQQRPNPGLTPEPEPTPEADSANPDPLALIYGAQQSAGNRATGELVQRLGRARSAALGRQPAPAPTDAGTPSAGVAPAPAHAGLADAEAFKTHAPFGPQDVVPATSGRGGFEVTYDPSADKMQVKMRCGVVFKDAVTVSGGTVSADPSVPGVLADLPPAGPRRTAFIDAHQWKAGQKADFMAGVKSAVESAWSNQYEFHVNKPDWEWIGASVNIDIEVHEQAGARAATDHLEIDSVKVVGSEDINKWGASTATDRGTNASPTDQSMIVGSTDIAPRMDNLLRSSVFFGNDSADLTADATAAINKFATTFNGAAPGTQGSAPANVTLEAHASKAGTAEHNMTLAQSRADAVRTQLTTAGFRNITTRVTDDVQGEAGATGEAAHDRRVDMIADGGAAQVVIAHEFGHAFGLADEYTNAPADLGTAAGHSDDVKAMQKASGLPETGAIREDNGNMMAEGTIVKPQHYATFHHALVTVTSINEWALGPKQAKPDPNSAAGGTAPAPAPDGGTPPPPPPPGP